MRPITDDMQDEIDELRDTVDTLRRQGRVVPVMTLREYYAGLAMQGLLSNKAVEEYRQQLDKVNVPERRQTRAIALTAIAHADALIAELQRENQDE